MSDSAFSQRRQILPVELFDQIMALALEPLAVPVRQPQSFFEGYRLVGVGGTQWCVGNAPAIPDCVAQSGESALASSLREVAPGQSRRVRNP